MSDTSQQAIIQALPVFPSGGDPAPTALRDLNVQLRALRVAWIFFGIVGLGAGVIVAGGAGAAPWPVVFLFGACWMTFGVGASARKLWSVQGGLFLSYLALAISTLSCLGSAATGTGANESGLTNPLFAVILQALVVRAARIVLRSHRVLGAQSPLA